MEEELEGVENAMHGVERQADYLNNRSQLSTGAKILVGATSPLWIPVGVAGFVIGMPFVTAIAVQRRLSGKMKLNDYEEQPRDYVEKRSRKFLASSSKIEEAINAYAGEQMTKTADILSTYADMIPRVIEADRKMVSQLRNETRSQDVVLQQYTPIQQKSLEVRKEMIPLGIELCPATMDVRDLHWKADRYSCLGEGEFSVVYRAKLKKGERDKMQHPNDLIVAVKEFKQSFDDLNSRFYLNEEMKITSLDHKNVLKFYGTVKVNASNTSNRYKFAFVMKFCQANLRKVIFSDKSKTPSKAENSKQAIDMFLKWAIEIADGLNYIHERGLVHRHLKLENILVDVHCTAMIGDIGIVGKFKETEKSIIYLAPEVLEDLEKCTKAADIYSYGIMLWEMWYGTQAYEELMPLNKTTFQKNIVDNNHRPKIDEKTIISPGVYAHMQLCWAPEANKRLSAKECYEKFTKILDERNNTDNSKL